MNNVDCSSIPGHWTQQTLSLFSHPFLLFTLTLCILTLLFLSVSTSYLLSVSLSSISTFLYTSLSSSSSSVFFPPRLPLPDPFLSPSLFVPLSVKALRNYSQWFFPCLGLSWVLGWFVRSSKVSCCCEYISPITSYIHPYRKIAWRKHAATQAANFESCVAVIHLFSCCLCLFEPQHFGWCFHNFSSLWTSKGWVRQGHSHRH